MYDELVKALRETDFSDGCPCEAEPMCNNKDCVILQAADAIEELMRRCEQFQYMPLPAWVPVTKRLPEPDTNVLVKSGSFVSVWSLREGDVYWEDEYSYFHDMCEVTHWMPLPEPPKEEK